ncbi:hypothetical protein JTE90_010117 [Oedothorax gibbosus]|uniref:Uncharacterized protein n=1 Tax=Oedothorax gibbosus TaxID=931172 RepID=A0AAV6UFB6_9ARAC|nr:hypothetical protein JTE90_010117 [Oedothorax gibbosus]
MRKIFDYLFIDIQMESEERAMLVSAATARSEEGMCKHSKTAWDRILQELRIPPGFAKRGNDTLGLEGLN